MAPKLALPKEGPAAPKQASPKEIQQAKTVLTGDLVSSQSDQQQSSQSGEGRNGSQEGPEATVSLPDVSVRVDHMDGRSTEDQVFLKIKIDRSSV